MVSMQRCVEKLLHVDGDMGSAMGHVTGSVVGSCHHVGYQAAIVGCIIGQADLCGMERPAGGPGCRFVHKGWDGCGCGGQPHTLGVGGAGEW